MAAFKTVRGTDGMFYAVDSEGRRYLLESDPDMLTKVGIAICASPWLAAAAALATYYFICF